MIEAGGHRLAVESCGAPAGRPVFLLHGTPGSRSGPRPRDIVLYRLGVRLISYDRPGYGRSSRQEGRTVASAASDVEWIADELGLDTFGVVGRSGGGPHALACAALLGSRVNRVAALVSLAPADADGLDWYGGMADSNVAEYSRVDASERLTIDQLRSRAANVQADPEELLRGLLPELTGPDRRVVDDIGLRRLLTETYSEALYHSPNGWIDDVLALRRPWKFELSDIRVPVLLWHGAEDTFSPVGHTRWLAGRIPTATMQIEQGAAHFSAVEVLPRVLAWVTEPGDAQAALQSAGAGLPR